MQEKAQSGNATQNIHLQTHTVTHCINHTSYIYSLKCMLKIHKANDCGVKTNGTPRQIRQAASSIEGIRKDPSTYERVKNGGVYHASEAYCETGMAD